MKIVAGSDWRDAIPFETPIVVADLAAGEDARCAGCGPDAAAHPRTELWAVKHRHPKNHSGFVRFYCLAHRPAPPAAPPARSIAERASRPPKAAAASSRSERIPKRAAPTDVVRAMCPDCYVEVSAKGECGVCGQVI
jgi:hypothetical protein